MVKKIAYVQSKEKISHQWQKLLKYYACDGDAWSFIRLEI